MHTLSRLLEPLIPELLVHAPVVVLEGGRGTGKSTLCDRLAAAHGWAARLDLSDRAALATLRLDPERFLAARPTPCVVDEAQLEPEITLWVKRIADARARPGQFLLTGSARLGRDALGGSDPLAGRAVRVQMWSMTQRELVGRPSDFVARAFGTGWTAGDREGPAADPRRGGLPSIAGVRAPAPAAVWEREIASYVEAVLPLGASGTRADLGRLLRTFRYFAANSGQMVALARVASDLGMQAATVRNHLEILESSFLLFRVEAERPTEHRVLTAHPRVFATDVGLAAWAARAWEGEPDAAVAGSLAETVVAHALAAQASAAAERVVLRHWRDTRTQREVDLLLCHPDGRFVPIEVKAAARVGPADTAGLQAFVAAHRDRCARAAVIYEGEEVLDLTPRGESVHIHAVPRAML